MFLLKPTKIVKRSSTEFRITIEVIVKCARSAHDEWEWEIISGSLRLSQNRKHQKSNVGRDNGQELKCD